MLYNKKCNLTTSLKAIYSFHQRYSWRFYKQLQLIYCLNWTYRLVTQMLWFPVFCWCFSSISRKLSVSVFDVSSSLLQFVFWRT